MKSVAVVSVVVAMSCVAGQALAACETATRVTGTDLSTLISGSLVCGRPAGGYAGAAGDRWQEEHRSGGQLWDYKKGPAPAEKIDPSKQVGTWSIANNTVTHSYTGGPSFTWTVHGSGGGVYSFCTGENGSEVVRAFISAGTGPCAGYP